MKLKPRYTVMTPDGKFLSSIADSYKEAFKRARESNGLFIAVRMDITKVYPKSLSKPK